MTNLRVGGPPWQWSTWMDRTSNQPGSVLPRCRQRIQQVAPSRRPSLLDLILNRPVLRPDYFSGKGSALMEPSRCLSKICTLLSALSSSCLHCAERRMPSSNILIESSSGKSPRSSWATIPSNCFSDSSNVANAGPHHFKNLNCVRIAPGGHAHLHSLDHRPSRVQHFARDLNSFSAGSIRSVRLLHAQHD